MSNEAMSNEAMSQQSGTSDPADPGGVEATLDSGLAESDAQGEHAVDADLQSGAAGRTDPDDPQAAIQRATEQSRGQD